MTVPFDGGFAYTAGLHDTKHSVSFDLKVTLNHNTNKVHILLTNKTHHIV